MRKVWILALASVLALALASSSLAGGLSAQGEVSVEELADGVYLYTYEVHRSLFLVTDGGVLVTDPQSGEAAARYLEEIRKITDAPVRYLVYSHHHGDHVSGGAAFGEEPVVVAHANVPPHVSGNEAIVPPELTFEQRATIWLDDLEVRLIYPGPSETDSNVIVHVPERDVAFMVDAVRVRSVPWRDMADGDALAWVEALRRLEELDFEILAPGHGPTGEKAHVTE